ncbi:amino acid transporter [Peribacillus cavernae]|uniref:Amino acid transporter n=1 Tax=Peribacillus cavernae TaxID=1674310 RepID=A0A3S0UC17_9BACI|nr:LysE family translocator [Peribacillus cavernae]MDQ0220445.1 threonine/homoserine/homoserine lactone efflux protein [Peribacillus cavernae]RUQ28048.1 amino acid transporter [Peribacillus cavernae]
MNILIGYIFLGLSLAAPIGPINAAQLDRGIKNGFWNAWILGLGAALADAIYMGLVYLGVVHFLETPFMKTFLWLFGFFVLIYTGIESMISAGKISTGENRSKESLPKSFFAGFLMSLSNPLTILFWLGIYGSVLANASSKYDFDKLLLFSCAIFFGIFIWDFSMAFMASTARRFLTPSLLKMISLLSGLSLVGFGIYFGIQAAKVFLS